MRYFIPSVFCYSAKLSDKWTNMEKNAIYCICSIRGVFFSLAFLLRSKVMNSIHLMMNAKAHHEYIGSNGIDCKRVSFKK